MFSIPASCLLPSASYSWASLTALRSSTAMSRQARSRRILY